MFFTFSVVITETPQVSMGKLLQFGAAIDVQ